MKMSVIENLLVLMLVGLMVDSTSVVSADSSFTYIVGQTATIACSTSIDNAPSWTHTGTGERSATQSVYSSGTVLNGYRERFSVDTSIKRQFNLTIKDVQISDAGLYQCIDKDGLEDTIIFVNLTVVSPDVASTEANEPIPETTQNIFHQSINFEWTNKNIVLVCVIVLVATILGAIFIFLFIKRKKRRNAGKIVQF